MNRHHRTQQTYDLIAARFLQRNRNRSALRPWLLSFKKRLPSREPVVDLGAGPCHDSAELRALGVDVISVDLSHEMLKVGREQYPGDRVQADMRLLPFRAKSIGGVWASASLLHLDRSDLIPALTEIRNVLVPQGILYLSLKHGITEGWDVSKWGPDAPRWFTYWSENDVDSALQLAGFTIVQSATDQGPQDKWITRLAQVKP
jgi:SAM-dependent methyltransferase